LTNDDLDHQLKEFYANARTEKGELYKLSSFQQIRYGLSKHLKENDIDIDGPDFNRSNETFKAVKVDLIRKGKGEVDHYPPIEKGDLRKLYEHPYAFKTDVPMGIQKKVLFEVIMYFCRRGRENIAEMKKSTFVVRLDDEGREFVEQAISERDKNHREGSEAMIP
jgi:hypothetical protein